MRPAVHTISESKEMEHGSTPFPGVNFEPHHYRQEIKYPHKVRI